MTPPLGQAFELLIVGMFTVALVLGLVVITGKLLIKTTNALSSSTITPTTPSSPILASNSTIDPTVLAVLTATVEVASKGQGSISRIESI